VTAPSRAEALYVEVTGLRREELAHAMAAFRAALERQDAALIEETRGVLVTLTGMLARQ